jgi:hypothetical protein
MRFEVFTAVMIPMMFSEFGSHVDWVVEAYILEKG